MRKVWKAIKYLFYAAAFILLADLAVVIFFSFYRPVIHPTDDIVVLGAAANTPAAYNRSLQGLKLYQQGLAPAIVVSGGKDYSRGPTEAGYMERIIEANSSTTIPIIVEDKSYSTYQNLANTRAIIGYGKSIIIVSDTYHLARSVLMADRLGFNPVYWSSPSPDYYTPKELVYYYLREVFAMIDYVPKFVTGK